MSIHHMVYIPLSKTHSAFPFPDWNPARFGILMQHPHSFFTIVVSLFSFIHFGCNPLLSYLMVLGYAMENVIVLLITGDLV